MFSVAGLITQTPWLGQVAHYRAQTDPDFDVDQAEILRLRGVRQACGDTLPSVMNAGTNRKYRDSRDAFSPKRSRIARDR